jgi:putative Holliday junction resolvase
LVDAGSRSLPEELTALLALDVGEARIGLAFWDAVRGVRDEGVLRRSSLADDLRRLAHVVGERRVTSVVVGLPLNADGSAGPQAKRSRRFAAALARAIAIPVVLFDESETTLEATAELGLGGRPLGDRERGLVDSRSAAILLRRYLESAQTRQ